MARFLQLVRRSSGNLGEQRVRSPLTDWRFTPVQVNECRWGKRLGALTGTSWNQQNLVWQCTRRREVMRSIRKMTRPFVVTMAIIAAVGLGIGLNLTLAPVVKAQAGLSTGSIHGTILAPKGSTVPAAKVSITSKATGAKLQADMSPTGTYNSGPLVPGEYLVRVEASGFNTVELPATVQVGNITTSSVALEVGTTTTVITVESAAITLNTEQSTIQGVVTQQQIENLPINGRNFLDLAQLEPGVQIQDGGNFDPTKKGFSSISFGGRFGRTARIEVDGLDISDETVGTTTQNIPINSIKEFQVSQSSLDLATELRC